MRAYNVVGAQEWACNFTAVRAQGFFLNWSHGKGALAVKKFAGYIGIWLHMEMNYRVISSA